MFHEHGRFVLTNNFHKVCAQLLPFSSKRRRVIIAICNLEYLNLLCIKI